MAHLVTSAPFWAGHLPVSGQLCEAAAEGGSPGAPVSCGLSACRHSLVGHPFPPWELVLPCGWLTGTNPDPDGVSTFRTARDPTGEGASKPRGHGVLTADASSPAAVAASLRQALPPALRPISRGHCHEASNEGIACAHPSDLPLACGPRMERAPLGFSPDASHPAVASDARQGDGSRTLLRSSLSSTSRSSNQ